MLADQEKCARRGREQGDRSRRKVEKEEREAEKRSKAMEDRKKKEDEFFEKNKSKFEKEEREFDAKEKEVKEKQRKVEEDKQFSSDKPGEGQTTKDELEEKSKEEDRVSTGFRLLYRRMPTPIYRRMHARAGYIMNIYNRE